MFFLRYITYHNGIIFLNIKCNSENYLFTLCMCIHSVFTDVYIYA